MVASPKPAINQSLIHQHNSVTLKSTPPRTSPGSMKQQQQSPSRLHGSVGGGSTLSNASRGSNNSTTRPSSSPEARSVRSGSGSKGSMENVRDGASILGGSVHEDSAADGASPTRRPAPSSLAVNTRSPIPASAITTATVSSPKTPSISLPKNPRDTAAYISPGTNNPNTLGSASLSGALPPTHLPSPQRRNMKSMEQVSRDFTNFDTIGFSSNNSYAMGASNAGGMNAGGGAAAGGGGRSVGGKSVKSVPSHPSYGTSARAVASSSPYGGGSQHGSVSGSGRPSTPTSSPLLTDMHIRKQYYGTSTPGSAASLHSMGMNGPTSSSMDNNIINQSSQNNNSNTPLGSSSSSNHGGQSQTKHSTQLDDEEQFMFEQRLTQDELGVAIRKISHSGKAQLRYVKCVPLRPPSSSDFDDDQIALVSGTKLNLPSPGAGLGVVGTGASSIISGASGRGGGGQSSSSALNVPYLDALTGTRTAKPPPSDSMSVSSKSSTGSRFMGRMRSMGRLIPNNTNSSVGGGGGGGSVAGRGEGGRVTDNLLLHDNDKSLRALTWGKKNAVTLSLDKFTCVRKGKTTERTIRNSSPSSRLLSIITTAGTKGHKESLDIEAPTKLDRDKFASAFARFLGVPLVDEDEYMRGDSGAASASHRGTRSGGKKKIRTPSLTRSKKKSSAALSAAHSEPGPIPSPSATSTPKVRNQAGTNASDSLLPALTPNSDKASDADRELSFDNNNGSMKKQTIGSVSRKVSENEFSNNATAATPMATSASVVVTLGSRNPSLSAIGSTMGGGDDVMSRHTLETMSESARKRISLDGGRGESMLEPRNSLTPQDQDAGVRPDPSGEMAAGDVQNTPGNDTDNHSHVSSLTGGVDQEIVEELHQAIIELRSELDASRAEAARAVKVAEQAIQSAENCTSSDWNSTVTHKAAEAAAQAQKKSAEAIARARMAEERLAAERKSTSFWRRQAQASEEEAGSLKTRSAAAQVKQAVMMEELASERRKAARMFHSLKSEFVTAEKKQEEEISVVQEQKRKFELELEESREQLERKEEETKKALETENDRKEKPKGPNRMVPNFRRPRSSSLPRPPKDSKDSKDGRSSPTPKSNNATPATDANKQISALQAEATSLRKQFELVRLTSRDEILSLHRQSEEWSNQTNKAVAASTAETDHLREKLAAESAMRLKLLNELQDIRGTVRVYCRPKPTNSKTKSIIKIPTHDILVLNEESAAMSFKYDRVFSPGASQQEVFSELEEPLISSLDGFNVALLAFGAGGSGKSHTLLGGVSMEANDEGEPSLPSLKSHGVQLQSIQQLFTIASHRTDRYKDAFSMTIVEVYNEKLFDLAAGTPTAERDGDVIICETRDNRRDQRRESGTDAWRKGKLEIRTNIDGNTVVQGLVSIPINSFEDALTIWQESIASQAERLQQQGLELKKHERKSNIITTIHITSMNIATGVGTEGKLQFVDMAASDIVPGAKKAKKDDVQMEEDDTQFDNKSIGAFNDVINARCQFDRSVPYRNSTLTHLLRDSLEADTKVLLMCCVSSDEANLIDTVGALQFASRMQKVSIGKATKHITGGKEC